MRPGRQGYFTMCKPVRLILLCLTTVLIAGCPRPLPQDYQFTSAAAGGDRGALFDGAPSAPTDAEDGGEAEREAREVVEPDVVRRDGDRLYILNQHRGLLIADLAGNTLLGSAPTFGYPRDLYLVGDRAYVLVGYAGGVEIADGVARMAVGSRLYVVDVADPAAPAVIGTTDLPGDFVDSRLVGEVLYAVSAEFRWWWEDTAPGGPGAVAESPGVAKEQTSASWVSSIDVSNPAAMGVVDSVSLEGFGNLIQATADAIFVVAGDWQADRSVITYVDISDPAGAIAVRGSVAVRGQVPDRFKLNAWQGVLRVVSATGWPNREVLVTTVGLGDPDALAVLGETSIEGAENETLFATRFDGPRAYVVTYLIVDPLFVLDLGDPTAPKVSGVLEVPGWSTHIEPLGDRLLALGVDDTDGGRRVSMSLFDVADPAAPGLLDRVSFGEQWSWSSAYEDVKALTVLDGLVLVPFSGWSGESGGFERLQLVGHTRDTLTAHGHVDVQGQIRRSLEHGADLFCLTDEQLVRFDASDPEAPAVVDTLTLAENVTDYLELGPDLGAMIVTRWGEGDVLVRTVDAAGAALGSVAVAAENLAGVFAHGTSVALVSTGWAERGYYEVHWVDCGDPATPVWSRRVRVDFNPYWGGWGWWDQPVPMAGRPAMDLAWWPGGVASDAVLQAGKWLVLRGSAETYDTVIGGDAAGEGVALVDLEAGALAGTVGFGLRGVESLHAANGAIYVCNREDSGADLLGRAVVAYFLRRFDPATRGFGAAANVPGRFLQYDPWSRVLVLEDYQYRGFTGLWREVATVLWDGGAGVQPVDRAALPENAGRLLGSGARVVFEQWDGDYAIGSLAVGTDGRLRAGEPAMVSGAWASLLDARGDRAYVNVGGRAVAQYDLSGRPVLLRVDNVMSVPWKLRFGAEAAFGPLGFSGLLRLPYAN
jgi:hypothetical protein